MKVSELPNWSKVFDFQSWILEKNSRNASGARGTPLPVL